MTDTEKLLVTFGSLLLALQRLEQQAKDFTAMNEMGNAARAWSQYHAIKAELHDLAPSLAGIRWEDFR